MALEIMCFYSFKAALLSQDYLCGGSVVAGSLRGTAIDALTSRSCEASVQLPQQVCVEIF